MTEYRLRPVRPDRKSGQARDAATLIQVADGEIRDGMIRRVSHWYKIRDAINDYLDDYEATIYGDENH